jgi:hypothetical protein
VRCRVPRCGATSSTAGLQGLGWWEVGKEVEGVLGIRGHVRLVECTLDNTRDSSTGDAYVLSIETDRAE